MYQHYQQLLICMRNIIHYSLFILYIVDIFLNYNLSCDIHGVEYHKNKTIQVNIHVKLGSSWRIFFVIIIV